ncbi:hypothetical protein L0F63_004772 [Massospora cicadina]|nr:hypothetical protein L0F63_004772 [Massospora cicadina]
MRLLLFLLTCLLATRASPPPTARPENALTRANAANSIFALAVARKGFCIQTERTCDVCSRLICVPEPPRSHSVLVPVIAGSVVSGVILLLGSIVSFFYYRNPYIKYKAQRDSILKQVSWLVGKPLTLRKFNDEQVLLSKRSSSLTENKRSSVASMFFTAKSQNMNTRVQPRVMVLGDDTSVASVGSHEKSVEHSTEISESYPHDGPMISNSALDAPARDSFGLSSFGVRTSNQPSATAPRTPRVYSNTDSQRRSSTDSFATQILSNPLNSSELKSRPTSSSDPFLSAQRPTHGSTVNLTIPLPSADPRSSQTRNSQVLPSEESIIRHFS